MKRSRAICGVATVLSVIIFIISFIYISSDEYFSVIGLYKQPICEIDFHYFEDDICSECNSSICKSGILCPLSEEYEYNIDNKDSSLNLRFSDYFSSYADYFEHESKLCKLAIVILLDLFICITLCITDLVLFIKSMKKKEGNSK